MIVRDGGWVDLLAVGAASAWLTCLATAEGGKRPERGLEAGMGRWAWGVFCMTLCSLTMGPSCSPHAEKGGSGTWARGQTVSLRVLWTVTSYVRAPDALWTEDRAKSMLFKPLDMDETTITFDGRICNGLTFIRERVQLDTYLSGVHGITPGFLGVEAEEAVLTRTECDIPGFDAFLRLPDRRLIVTMGGVFFILEPHVSH